MKHNTFLIVCLVGLLTLGIVQSAPAAGKTLVYAAAGEATSLDVGDGKGGHSRERLITLYEGLIRFKYGTTKIEPCLATSWDVSADGKEIVFHLRKGVKFHDGTDFNANAVVFNFARQYDPNHPYHKYGEWVYYNYLYKDIKEWVKVDDYTVKAVLVRPNVAILYSLGHGSGGIASPTAIKKHKEIFFKNPSGTGAYRFVEWVKDDHITMDAFDDYWGGRPKLDRIIFKVIPDPSARLMSVEVGETQVMEFPNPADFRRVRKKKDLQIITGQGMNTGFICMNTGYGYRDKNKNGRKDPDEPLEKTPGYLEPLTKKKVRQAINMAIDKKAIAENLYMGTATPAKNCMPPFMLGYNDEIVDYPYDPEKAKKLLAEAGYPKGFKVTLWVMPVSRPYMFDPPKVGVAVQSYLAQVGIKVDFYQTDWGTYLQETEDGKHQMCLIGWTGDNGDPDNFFNAVFGPNVSTIGSASNRSFYMNMEYQEILNQALQIYDPQKRAELYKKAAVIQHEDAAWVFLVHADVSYIAQKNIGGFKVTPFAKPQWQHVFFK